MVSRGLFHFSNRIVIGNYYNYQLRSFLWCDDDMNLVASYRRSRVVTLILYVISNYRTIGLVICKDAQ